MNFNLELTYIQYILLKIAIEDAIEIQDDFMEELKEYGEAPVSVQALKDDISGLADILEQLERRPSACL